MSRTTLTYDDAKKAVYGGCILGGGGGGWIKDGLEKSEIAFSMGTPELISIEELQDEDYVVSVSLVGAPSAKDIFINSEQLIDTVNRMQRDFDKPIKALTTNENGAATTVNGWLQSAATGLPILDAPCNGRAHPTGSMGSMNLSDIGGYISLQTFAGGKRDKRVEGAIKASLDLSSNFVRTISMQAGGMVGVCRNPIDIGYVKENAAVGGISQAIALGNVFLSVPEGPERIKAVIDLLEGQVVHSGRVSHFQLDKTGGFDVGHIQLDDLELTFWNEYMTVEKQGKRKSTFPDLIMTFNAETGMPLVSAEIKEDMHITIISVPKENLTLGSTMFNKKLLKAVEPIIKKCIVNKEMV